VTASVSLATTYLGLSLRNPLVASPSPATSTVDRLRALADAGVGAVVLPSLYEEQVNAEELHELDLTEPFEDAHGEAQGYFPGCLRPHCPARPRATSASSSRPCAPSTSR
jgi:dihydroorotate dehydrogenase (fumarate)